MKLNHLFRLTLILQLMAISSALAKRNSKRNATKTVNVLAAAFPPFTYFDKDRGFVGGIDVLLLKTIGKRLGYQLVLNKTDSFDRIPAEKIE